MISLAVALCLDIEASSLAPNGYPIEIGLADPATGEAVAWLIRPAAEWIEAGDWNAEAEAVHGIGRAQIDAEGVAVAEVIDAVNARAFGRTVLSDCTSFDGRWLTALYRAGGYERPPFTVEDFGCFAWEVARRAGRRPDIAYSKAEAEAWAAFPITHRAAQDASHNAEILRQLAGQGV